MAWPPELKGCVRDSVPAQYVINTFCLMHCLFFLIFKYHPCAVLFNSRPGAQEDSLDDEDESDSSATAIGFFFS